MLQIQENYKENIYFIADPPMFNLLRSMYLAHRSFGAIFQPLYKGKPRYISNELTQLKIWIYACTSKYMPSDNYSIWQRVEWILNNRTDFPRCQNPHCNRLLSEPRSFCHRYGYYDYCCNKCTSSDPKTAQKAQATRRMKYNGRNESIESTEKRKQTCLKKYGVDHNMKSEIGLAKYKAGMQKKYGVDFNFKRKDFRQQARSTKLKRYGSPTYNNQTKHLATDIANGHKGYWTNPKQRETTKAQKRMDDPSYIEQRNEKFKQTSIARYGYDNPMKSAEVQARQRRKYIYDGNAFDSAPEIALYIWLKDNQQAFTYHPRICFEYKFDDKAYVYSPDFYLTDADKYIELKGNHFFKDGDPAQTMICPYRHKSWSNAQYLHMCDKYEAKHQCMLKNNVQIMTSKDYLKYEKYVEDKYGKGYIEQFRRK